MQKDLIELAAHEARAIRLFVNPQNLSQVFPEDIKPLSKRYCLHSICFRGSSSYTMKDFMKRDCEMLVRNPVLTKSASLYITEYRLVLDNEWRFLTTTGYYLRLYSYLTPLEYYMIDNPKKTEEILNYIKNVNDDLIL